MGTRRIMLTAMTAAAIALAIPGTALAATGGYGAAASHAVSASSGTRTVLLKDVRLAAPQSPVGAAAPDAPPATSTFNFENSNIAKFSATLTFHSDYSFTISNVRLSDTLADNRSVLALAEDNNFAYAKGTDPGLYTWKNSSGAGSTLDGATYTFESSDPVQYVQIALYAANENGQSSIVYSLKHANPYY
jgi:hypothetical protein